MFHIGPPPPPVKPVKEEQVEEPVNEEPEDPKDVCVVVSVTSRCKKRTTLQSVRKSWGGYWYEM